METPLVGRRAELEAVLALVHGLRHGRGGTVLIQGEPGIGKTALVDAALTAVGAPIRLLRAAADPMDLERPFGVVWDAVTGILTPDDLQSDAADDSRLFFTEELCRQLQSQSMEQPLLLAIEDLHWADPGSLTALNTLAKRASSFAIGLLLTMRPSDPGTMSHAFAQAQRARGAGVIQLEPLAPHDVVEMSASLLGAKPGPRLRHRLDSAGGNPLFISELLATLGEEGAIVTVEGEKDLDRDVAAPPLRMTILHRLHALDEPVIDVLRCAAVLGGSFAAGVVAAVHRTPELEVLRLLERAAARGFLVSHGGSWSFRHDVIREALYLDLPVDLRATMHADVARLLIERKAPEPDLLHHLANARFESSADLMAAVRRCADRVGDAAPEVAAALLERCLRHVDESSRDRFDVLEQLLLPLSRLGQVDRALEVVEELRSSQDVEQAARAHAWECRFAVIRETPADYARAAADALELPGLSPVTRAEFLGRKIAGLVASGALPEAVQLVPQCLELGRELGLPYVTAHARFTEQLAATLQGHYRAAGAAAEQVIDALDDPRLRGIIPSETRTTLRSLIIWACSGLIVADRLDDADRVFTRAMSYLERGGIPASVQVCHWGTASLRFHQGRWDDAMAELEAASYVGAVGLESTSRAATSRVVFDDPTIELHLERGNFAEAASALRDVELDMSDAEPGPAELRSAVFRGQLAMAQGKQAEGLDTFLSILETAQQVGLTVDPRLFALPALRAAAELGRTEDARRIAEQMADAASRARVPSVEAVSLACRSVVDGDLDAARQVLDAVHSVPRPFLRALLLEHAGDVLAASDRPAAVAALEEALEVFGRLEAAPADTRCRARLRRLGVHKGIRGQRPRAATGWEALTRTERRVVALLAEGLTNREIAERLFISSRTVETHVSHAFRKLRVSSRTELAAWVARET